MSMQRDPNFLKQEASKQEQPGSKEKQGEEEEEEEEGATTNWCPVLQGL